MNDPAANGAQTAPPADAMPVDSAHLIQALMNRVQQLVMENTMQSAIIAQLQSQQEEAKVQDG